MILSAIMFQSCHDTTVFTSNDIPPIPIGLYVSNFVHVVLNGVELELVYHFLYLAPFLRYLRLKSNIGILDLSP